MKKLFFTICFTFSFLLFGSAGAEISSITNMPKRSQPRPLTLGDILPDNMPDPNNEEEVRAFFKKRFEEAAQTVMDDKTDWNNASSVDVAYPPEYYQAQEEAQKTLFQKMYDQAVAAVTQSENAPAQGEFADRQVAQSATRFFTIADDSPKAQIARPEIPTVALSLPSGRKILAPAREHIPYFLSYIDIQSNGYIKVEDTITIVADGKKFAHGLTRIFPKYAKNSQRIELLLESVVVNNTKIPYTLEEIGDNIIMKPKYNQKLESGVYTYKFNYLVDNKLWRTDDAVRMDWNITGQPLNTFITSANAIVSLPMGYNFKNIIPLVGNNGKYTNQRTNVYNLAENVVAFSNSTPLLNGEEMRIIADMNSNMFIDGFDGNFNTFLTNWGNILYASLGLTAIIVSFILSLLTLNRERKHKFTPSYNGALMRSIAVNKYDKVAFVAQILDLYRKKVLDIKNDNNRLYLSKIGKNNAKLNNMERKALKCLFNKKHSETEVNTTNNLIFKKAHKIFENSAMKQIKKYRLVHNLSYIIFSSAMLLITEVFIAMLSINTAQSLVILLATTLLYAFYVWILRHKFKNKIISVLIKMFTLFAIFIVWIFSSIYVGSITSLLILAMVAVIFAFLRIFGEYNNFINDAKTAIDNYKEYLISSADAINLSRDFINQQANIYALNITEYFPRNQVNERVYQLDNADVLKQKLTGII
ncbi:MAG: DUF2207 domain-containing protein [Alphaproteobacteria bacterium]|nr:DUF2207 domain-containing protein [Alphaproteobacteria bacterium]